MKILNSYDFMQGKIVSIDWDNYCKDVIMLEHHYMCDSLFLDKIRENAKKLGYKYERHLNTLDYENISPYEYPSPSEKLTVFTKIDTEKTKVFPEEKIAVYRAYSYLAESSYITAGIETYWDIRHGFEVNNSIKELYKDYIRLFCGAEGFEYQRTFVINPINTILIVILDDPIGSGMHTYFFPKVHKNYVLFCLISTSSPHQIFIAPDLRVNKDSDYQKKIEELKFLLGINELNDNL